MDDRRVRAFEHAMPVTGRLKPRRTLCPAQRLRLARTRYVMSMFCVYCDHDNRSERNFCAQCGASLVSACKHCNFRNYENEDYCGGCGSWVRPGSNPADFSVSGSNGSGTSHSGQASVAGSQTGFDDGVSPKSLDGAGNQSADKDSKSSRLKPDSGEHSTEPARNDSSPAGQSDGSLNDSSLNHASAGVVTNVFRTDESRSEAVSFALFCELLDTDTLVQKVDAEVWRHIVRNYQRYAGTIIERFDGHLARITSQGIVAYFGYPQINRQFSQDETDASAQAAVAAALELVTMVRRLHEPFDKFNFEPLAARITVVAKKHGTDNSGNVNETISKLMRLAKPGKVIVDDTTYQLSQDIISSESESEPVNRILKTGAATADGSGKGGWHIIRARSNSTGLSLNPSYGKALSPLFGRERERQVLNRSWLDAQRGLGQVILIRGADGIGKSRLANEAQRIAISTNHCEDSKTLHLSLNCKPGGQADALYPFVHGLSRRLNCNDGDYDRILQAVRDCASQSDINLAVIQSLFGSSDSKIAELGATGNNVKATKVTSMARTPRDLKLGTLQSLFERLAQHNPVMITVEDAHWIDASSLELLSRLIVTIRTHPIFLVISSREDLPRSWHTHDHVQQIRLAPLDAVAGGQLISHVASRFEAPELSADQRKRILLRGDGVPLFLEQLSRAVCSQTAMARESVSVPDTLRDSLQAHLGEPSLRREIAITAAAIGIEFDLKLLVAISNHPQHVVCKGVDQLLHHGVIRELTDSVDHYQFQHALIHEAAYDSLQRSHRLELHRHIAGALANRNPSSDVGSRLIGWHYERAGDHRHAADFFEKAALDAYHDCMFNELIVLAERALVCLKQSATTAESQCREARLMVLLGVAHRSVSGVASKKAADTFANALQLASASAETDIWLDSTRGLFSCYFARGELTDARILSDETRALIDRGELTHGDEVAGYLKGVTSFWSGQFCDALTSFSEAREVLDQFNTSDSSQLLSEQFDLQANVLGLLSWTQWITGEPARAAETSRLALERAHESGQPLSTALTYFWIAATTICAGNTQQAERLIHRTGELAKANDVDYMRAVFTVIQGQVAKMSGDSNNGLALMSRGVEQMNDCEAGIGYPWVLSLVASAYLDSGYIEPAHDTVIEAIRRTDLNGEHHWIADLYRIKGQICIRASETDEGRRWLHRAFETARSQGARALELRTLLNISQLRDAKAEADASQQQPNRSADLSD